MIIAIGALSLALWTVGALQPAWRPGTNIQRTMRLLATSTREHPNHVKILFYGQSITKQNWWKEVAADLKGRFPYADLECENRAIGGFAANLLKKVVPHDVYPSYPELIILHDYGGEPDYEELVHEIRSHVASELLVQSDHYVDASPGAQAWHDQHVDWLRNLALKQSLGFVDVRTPWKSYLAKNNLKPADLLIDGVHLNERGCDLMASLIEPALVYDPAIPPDPGLCRSFPPKWDRGSLKLRFEGNRVDLRFGSGNGSSIKVLIDGLPPSAFPELYQTQRPSDCFACDVPAVFRVDSLVPKLVEDWTLTLKSISADTSRWSFSVVGSKTGPDGDGESDKPFVSNSRRVAIAPDCWYVHEASQITHRRPPEGFTVRWKVVPEFLDSLELSNRTVTVAKGLKNVVHVLELISTGTGSKLAQIDIYRPPLKE